MYIFFIYLFELKDDPLNIRVTGRAFKNHSLDFIH